ncbi:DUF4209 domain-containing protein [Marinobacter sp. KM021]|uniref:DUF4209 domain-containing protein n=1 Tax=Marinobacter sp. KM021 TaxID=3075616 RepID=UPI003D6A4AB7
MSAKLNFNSDQFVGCGWTYTASPEDHYGYSSVMQSLHELAKEKRDEGQVHQAEMLELLERAASMMLVPDSVNEPFMPYIQDFQTGRRSAIPEDFTKEELEFFEIILSDMDEPWLKARLSDLLWLCKRPKNPDNAILAVESYISHPIDSNSWRKDIDNCWERAARIAMQIKAKDKIELIRDELFSAFNLDYPECAFMVFWLADLLDRLKIDSEYRSEIASRLFQLGSELKEKDDFYIARSYFELAQKKFKQGNDEQGWLDSLVSIADCFEKEADSRTSDSNMVANSFYENAMQAYRRVPIKYRDTYDVENKLKSIRDKISVTGKASLAEMGVVRTPGFDVSDMVEISIAHVAGKHSLEEALMHFVGLYPGPEYQSLTENARENIQQNPFSSLIGSCHIRNDGRVVAKTPAANLSASDGDPSNQAVLNRKILQLFEAEVRLTVYGQILPALSQIQMEYRVTKDFLQAVCHQSPLVSEDRIQLLAFALWLGFEHDFGNSVHLVCPQIENIIRGQLKESGVHTSNIDREGIENENGLSTLIDLPEAKEVFGDDLAFEIKSVFTDTLGFNLRNEVAHGLLNDSSSNSISAIYAWWMSLRLILNSIIIGSFSETKESSNSNDSENNSDPMVYMDDDGEGKEYIYKDVTSGAFTQVVVEEAGRIVWRSSLELTGSDKHKANRKCSQSTECWRK